MKLEGIQVENFRGIEKNVLDNIGDFNVLVGKNNSGKSTIVFSINYFLKIINSNIVSYVFEKEDYYKEDSTRQIRMVGSFVLDNEIFDELLNKMEYEHLQLKAAIDTLKNFKYLNIYTCSLKNRSKVAYIEKVTISKESIFGTQEDETVLFNINENLAEELLNKNEKISEIKDEIAKVNRNMSLRKDDFKRIKEHLNTRKDQITRRIPGLGYASPEMIDNIDQCNTYDEYINSVKSLLEDSEMELNNIQKSESSNEYMVFSGKSKEIPKHISWLINEVDKNMKVIHELDRKDTINGDDARKLLNLKVARGGIDRLTKLQDTVERLLGVKIDAFQKDEDYYGSNAEIDVDNFLVEMNGSGIKEALRLILDLEFSEANIIIVEEPEIHLHYSLEKMIFKYLIQISKDKQVFITTHSTAFIDACNPNNVLLVKKKDNIKVKRLSDDGLPDVINELGVNISTLLLSKTLIFVEGLTDEHIIKSYIDKEVLNAEVAFVLMNGVGNYKYYSNANSLKLLSSRGLQTVFLIDSDSRNKEQVEKIIKNHPEFSKVYTIDGRCIENLFLEAEIIQNFIERKIKKSKNAISIPDKSMIQENLDEILEKLYPETIKLYLMWKYMKPIYPKVLESDICSVEIAATSVRDGIDNIKNSVEEIINKFDEDYEVYLEDIKQRWEKDKINMVSGDKVIDEVCKIYNLRYKKNKEDAELLAQVAHECNKYPLQLKKFSDEIIQSISIFDRTILE